MFSYYRRVIRRALDEALPIFGWEKAGVVWTRLSIAIVVAAILVATGWYKLAFDQLWVGAITLAVGIGLFPLVFLWKVIVSAYLLDKERGELIDTLDKFETKFDDEVARELERLLQEGSNLIDHDALELELPPYQIWVTQLIKWCGEAEQLVENHLPRGESVGFKTNSVFPGPSHTNQQLRYILGKRHSKLRLIAMPYMENAPTM